MIGCFGKKLIFEVTQDVVNTIKNEMQRSYKAKIIEHKPIYGVGQVRNQGRELIEIKLDLELNQFLHDDIYKTRDRFIYNLEKGVAEFLVLGGNIIGKNPYIITGITEKNKFFNRVTGKFQIIELSLTLKEYIKDPKKYLEDLEKEETDNVEITESNKSDIEKEQKSKV